MFQPCQLYTGKRLLLTADEAHNYFPMNWAPVVPSTNKRHYNLQWKLQISAKTGLPYNKLFNDRLKFVRAHVWIMYRKIAREWPYKMTWSKHLKQNYTTQTPDVLIWRPQSSGSTLTWWITIRNPLLPIQSRIEYIPLNIHETPRDSFDKPSENRSFNVNLIGQWILNCGIVGPDICTCGCH